MFCVTTSAQQSKFASLRWFHGTSSDAAKLIEKSGYIEPQWDDDNRWGEGREPRDGAVYITTNYDVAKAYADDANEDDSGSVVFELAVPDPQNLIPDEDSINSALTRGSVAGDYHTAADIRTMWLEWYNETHPDDLEQHFDNAFKPWFKSDEICEGYTTEWSECVKDLAEHITKTNPALAKDIIMVSEKAAHIGKLKVLRRMGATKIVENGYNTLQEKPVPTETPQMQLDFDKTGASEGVQLTPSGSYVAPDSVLDYNGKKFEKLTITETGVRIGELDVQVGSKSVTTRNIILYDEKNTGRGVGKAVYTLLATKYKGKTIRSSFNVNRVKGTETSGLSEQAIHMWESFVTKGLARKVETEDGRFYYEMTGATKHASTKNLGYMYHGGRAIADNTLRRFMNGGQDAGGIFLTPSIEYAQMYAKPALYRVELGTRNIFDPENEDDLEQLADGFRALVEIGDYDDEESAMEDYHRAVCDDLLDWATGSNWTEAAEAAGFDGMRLRERNGTVSKGEDGYEVSGEPIESVVLFDKAIPAVRIDTPDDKYASKTDTDDFQSWFADSKVTDESGKPLKVFHGTAASFDEFSTDSTEGEHGLFFTDWAHAAGQFASSKRKGMGTAPGANVRPAYLSIRKPLIIDMKGKSKYNGFDGLIQRAKAAGCDGVIVKDVDDGVGYYDPMGGSPHTVYIVFKPEQVRTAFGSVAAKVASDVTQKPGFKAWFRGSKVVNQNGAPMVMYHGTTKDFDKFDTLIGEMGTHFGVMEHADAFVNERQDGVPIGANVKPCYLSIKNPLRLFDAGHFESGAVVGQLVDLGILDDDRVDDVLGGTEKQAMVKLRQAIIAAGCDGIVYLNRREGLSEDNNDGDYDHVDDDNFKTIIPNAKDSWIAFYPNQIKSAIGNSGTFDAENPSITASKTAMDRSSRNAHYFIAWLVKKGIPYDGSVRPFHSSSVIVTFPNTRMEVTFDRVEPEDGVETIYVGPGGLTPVEARRLVLQRVKEAKKQGIVLKDGEWVSTKGMEGKTASSEWARRWKNKQTLPVGTILYHGTSEKFDPAEIETPAWFSTSESVAKRFTGWHPGGSRPKIHQFRVTSPIQLPRIESTEEMERFAEKFSIAVEYGGEDMRDSLANSMLPGWVIPNNYGPGEDDIVLTSTDNVIPIYPESPKKPKSNATPGSTLLPGLTWGEDISVKSLEGGEGITYDGKDADGGRVTFEGEVVSPYSDSGVVIKLDKGGYMQLTPEELVKAKTLVGRDKVVHRVVASKTPSDEVEISEERISAEESSYEGTQHPGIRIEARLDYGTVGALEIFFEKGNAYVRGITVASQYQHRGIGQKLYDRAIALAKAEGCTNFYSDKANCMSKDADKAWNRLRTRYRVEFEAGEDGYDASGRKRISLKSAATKTAMNITVPESEETHFWEEPAEGMEEFWALRWPVRALVGDRIVFNLRKKPIAEAVISRIEKPGQHECSTTGRFKNMWKVYWTNESFKKLEPIPQVKTAAPRIPKEVYHGTSDVYLEYKSGFGVFYFTDSVEYAQYFADRAVEHGEGKEGKPTIWKYKLDLKNPFDARKMNRISYEEFAATTGVSVEDMFKQEGMVRSTKKPFWYWFRTFERLAKSGLQRQGYDGIVQFEKPALSYQALGMQSDLKARSYVVFSPSQFKKTAAMGSTYYHVTPHRRTSKILQEGLVTGKKPQWNNRMLQPLGDRNKVYLMNHFDAAVKWAAKMEWDKKTKIDILKIEMNIPDIEPDMNLEAQMNKVDGQYAWVMTSTPIPPEAIRQVIPLTDEMKQDFVKRQNEQFDKQGSDKTAAKDEHIDWNQLETGKPAVLYVFRGEGGGHALEPRYQQELGREFLLGDGFYFAPTEGMAKNWGSPNLYRVALNNPYVVSGNFSDLRGLNLEELKADGYDSIVIKSGRYGFGRGQEDLRQGIIFNPTPEQVAKVEDIPLSTNLTKGSTVRVKQPLSEGYVRQFPELANQEDWTGKVVRIGPWGHAEVKLPGMRKAIGFLPDEVELVDDGKTAAKYDTYDWMSTLDSSGGRRADKEVVGIITPAGETIEDAKGSRVEHRKLLTPAADYEDVVKAQLAGYIRYRYSKKFIAISAIREKIGQVIQLLKRIGKGQGSVAVDILNRKTGELFVHLLKKSPTEAISELMMWSGKTASAPAVPEDVIDTYGYGYCARLAIALNRRFGWPIQVAYSGGTEWQLEHAWVEHPSGRGLDIHGWDGQDKYLNDEKNPITHSELVDGNELFDYVGATEEEIDAAEAVIDQYIVPCYLNGEPKTASAEYPLAGDTVAGLRVRDDVPNTSSISASLTEYTVLKGIRVIPMSELTYQPPYSVSEKKRTEALAEEIKASGEINPLIVVQDALGIYILEGGHRFDALHLLGIKEFPAMVVIDEVG